MLALAAARLGLEAHIFSPDPESPAFDVCAGHTIARLRRRGGAGALRRRGRCRHLRIRERPRPHGRGARRALPGAAGPRGARACQDRLVEKDFLRRLGIATAPLPVSRMRARSPARSPQLGRPSILKTRRFGYDGKGQIMIREGVDLAPTFAALGGAPVHPRRLRALHEGSFGRRRTRLDGELRGL